jgi:hypothetical protein
MSDSPTAPALTAAEADEVAIAAARALFAYYQRVAQRQAAEDARPQPFAGGAA